MAEEQKAARHVLRDLMVNEISLVDEPANPAARVVVWKAARLFEDAPEAHLAALEERLEQVQEIAKTQAEALAVLEAARANRVFIEKASAWDALPLEPVPFAKILSRLEGADLAEIERVLSAANAMAKSLFAELGSSLPGPAGATERLAALARRRAEADGLSAEKAYADVVRENPDLYEQSLADPAA